ncbi:MAG: DUF4913 domain-containing protein [Actinobacteria bacterium]|nr:DUF4913 domain-containing protein [Actinomycetota bacterium]
MSARELPETPETAVSADDASQDLPRLGTPVSAGGRVRGSIRPINWNLLTSDQAEIEWLELNSWVSWLKLSYGLTPSVLPPLWHRHPELVWELSALHCHWLGAYDPEQHASGPLTWHRDFAEARTRLREWVQASGTRIDRDRPTRQTAWPGDAPFPPVEESPILDRDADFVEFVKADVASRRADEDAYYQLIAEEEARRASKST